MEDTIAAISTGMTSPGGISIIRISGSQAVFVADSVFQAKKKHRLSSVPSHTVHYGTVCRDGQVIDEALAVVMRAPNSYTREDVVEINCHGGMFVTKKVLEAVLSAGARLAEPGEFTKRAFLNGRIDLSQAEAVMDLIQAKNDYALKASISQLSGRLSEKIREIRICLLDHVAYIEAALDDPEHISLENYVHKLEADVDNIVNNVHNLLKNVENGRIMREGIRTVILGKTNAGKSSLLNMLAGQERAIVTDVEGTTRDVLEEQVNLGGVTLRLMDTAGIRNTEDSVEKIGVERAKKYAQDAELIIFVADSSRPLDNDDYAVMELLAGKKVIVLFNKSDLKTVADRNVLAEKIRQIAGQECRIIDISAKKQTGLDALQENINDLFFDGEISADEEIYITDLRHKELLQEALDSLNLVKDGISCGMSEDFLTIDLMAAYEKLGFIIGESVEEDLADQIFSKFCMGK